MQNENLRVIVSEADLWESEAWGCGKETGSKHIARRTLFRDITSALFEYRALHDFFSLPYSVKFNAIVGGYCGIISR